MASNSWQRFLKTLSGKLPYTKKSGHAAKRKARPRRTKLSLESLEDRVVPTGIGLVANNANASATVFSPITNTVLGTVSLLAGGGAYGDVAIVNNGTLGFVTTFQGYLCELDLTNPSVPSLINRIGIANPGEDLAVTADGKFLVVSDGSGSVPLAVVNIAAGSQVGTFFLGSDANSVDVSSNGYVLATSSNSDNLRLLTINSSGQLADTGKSLGVSGPMNVVAAPGGTAGVVVSNNGFIESFTIPNLTPVNTLSLGDQIISAVFDQAGDRVYVRNASGEVYAFGFNATTGQLSSSPLFTIGVSSASTFYGMDQLTISQDGSELYVPEDNSNTIDVFNANNGSFVTRISGGGISQPTGITISSTSQKLTPTLTVSDAGGTYNGQPFSATSTVNGGSSLEGVAPTLTYYSGTYNLSNLPTSGGSSSAPSAVGNYTVVANFAGSVDYTSATALTTFSIVPATTGLTVTPGGSVMLGSGTKLTASATLFGAVNPTGAITYTLYDPNGNVVYTGTNGGVNGDGTYSTPGGYLPTMVGTYHWSARYSGDNNNTSSTDNSLSQTATNTLGGIYDNYGVAIDSNGNVYVAESIPNMVAVFALGSTNPGNFLTGVQNPTWLAFAPNGDLYVASAFSSQLALYLPGSTTPATYLSGASDPQFLTVDASGNVYVANDGNNTVTKYAPGSNTPTVTLTGLNQPGAVAVDTSGNVYVLNNGNHTVSVFASGSLIPTGTLILL